MKLALRIVNDKYKKSNTSRYLLALITLFVVSANVLLFAYYKNVRKQVEQSYIQQLNNQYETLMGVYSDMATFIYEFYIDQSAIKELFAAGVWTDISTEQDHYRELLYNQMSDLYNMLVKYDFRQLHFHDKNSHSYLRFHRPEKYGDDLTGLRHSVVYVNKTQQPVSGFEEGRIFNGYRFVFPISLETQYVGSVEVSVSMKTVVNKLHKRFDQESQFIIAKQHVDAKVFKSERSNYSPWFVDRAYLLDNAIDSRCILKDNITLDDKLKIQKALSDNKTDKKPFCVEVKLDSSRAVLVFIPIINFVGENVAYVFSVSDGEYLRDIAIAYYYMSALMLVLFVLLLIFIFYYRFAKKRIERLANYDSLTDVYARRVIMMIAESEYLKYKRDDTVFSVIMMDIDYFKKINDTHGHAAGDKVLVQFCEIVKENIGKTGSLGRYGGEEFLVVLPNINEQNAVAVAEKLRQNIEKYNFNKVGNMTMSLGVAEVAPEMQLFKDIIKKADSRLYEAKCEGRNRVVPRV